jgi:hypothetical protein
MMEKGAGGLYGVVQTGSTVGLALGLIGPRLGNDVGRALGLSRSC